MMHHRPNVSSPHAAVPLAAEDKKILDALPIVTANSGEITDLLPYCENNV
jgi:hypothetical protein